MHLYRWIAIILTNRILLVFLNKVVISILFRSNTPCARTPIWSNLTRSGSCRLSFSRILNCLLGFRLKTSCSSLFQYIRRRWLLFTHIDTSKASGFIDIMLIWVSKKHRHISMLTYYGIVIIIISVVNKVGLLCIPA